MARPSVSVNISNGNLGLSAPNQNGIAVLLVAAPAAPTAGYGTAFLITNKLEAKAAFAHANNAPVLEAIEKGFYGEAPEGSKLYVLAMAQSTTLESLLATVNAEKALNLAGGLARLVAAVKFPADNYAPTIADGLDQDVITAVTAAQTLADSWSLKNKGFRSLIQAFGFTNPTDVKDYSAATNRTVGVVVGSIANSTATATLLALGRAASIDPQQNIGRVKTGSLNIDSSASVKIGATEADQVSSALLNSLHTKRYITFEKNEIAAGYVFNDDLMACISSDDYNNLRHGRIIDNAQRVAYAAYYEELKDDVEVDEIGRLDSIVEKGLETKIQVAIDQQMRGQLATRKDGSSDIQVLVNPDTVDYAALYAKNGISNPNLNIIQNETVYLFIFLKPKGCLKYIQVFLGLSTATV